MRKNLHVSFFLFVTFVLLALNCSAIPSQSKEEGTDNAFLFSLLSSGNTFAPLSSSGTTTTTTTSSGTTTSTGSSTNPSVSSFSPVFGVSGTVVTFSGSNLPTSSSAISVTINGSAMTAVTASTSTSFTATVASGTTSGSVIVTANNRSTTLSTSFSISPWQNLSANFLSTDNILRLSCPTSNTCFALTQSSTTTNANTFFWRTTDAGLNWTSFNTNASILAIPTTTTSLGSLAGGMSCPTVNTCYIVGSRVASLVYKVTNASATTPSIATQGGTNNFGYNIDCTSDTFCYMVGVNIVRRTLDGTNWSNVETGTSYMDVSCFGTDTCYISDSLTTANFKKITNASAGGGATITNLTLTGQSSRDAIKCTSANQCVVVGDSPSVARTTNGGTSWSTVSIPLISGTSSLYSSVDCLDSNSCTLGGSNTTIYRTGDAGASWTNQGFGATNRIFQISCANSPTPTCFAALSDGNFLRRVSN